MLNSVSFNGINSAYSNSAYNAMLVQPQAAQTQASVAVNFAKYAAAKTTEAFKAQTTAQDINFNNSFYANIQYLNAQASMNIHKQVDGKIFVNEDTLPVAKPSSSEDFAAQARLFASENIAKDKNGSEALFYFDKKNSNQEQDQEQKQLHQGRKLKLLFG